MSGVLFDFRNKFRFGTVEFTLGKDALPTKINDGDLDGDLYHYIWDMTREQIFKENYIIYEVYVYRPKGSKPGSIIKFKCNWIIGKPK